MPHWPLALIGADCPEEVRASHKRHTIQCSAGSTGRTSFLPMLSLLLLLTGTRAGPSAVEVGGVEEGTTGEWAKHRGEWRADRSMKAAGSAAAVAAKF